MVDPQPQPFTTASPVLVNFDFSDIASGTGYETYFLIESEDSGGKDYHLTSNNDFSNTAVIVINGSTFDQDFDLTQFAIPRDAEGTALFSLPIKSSLGATPDVIIELYKWDGSSETIIGSAVHLDAAADTVTMRYFNYEIPYTHFAVGDTLRLRLQVVQTSAISVYFGIDPAGRTDANLSITTTSKIKIPYLLNN